MPKHFQKRKEDFICAHCGSKVQGTGYTDHCPRCLWSRHCDATPGDRLAECQGLMEPLGVEIKGGEYVIYYQCVKCGYKHRVKVAKDDNFEEIIELT